MPHGIVACILAGCASLGETSDALGGKAKDRPKIEAVNAPPPLANGAETVSDAAMARYVRRAAEIAMSEGHIGGAAVHLSKLYDEQPEDLDTIYDYARHLRYVDALTEAELVLNNGLALYPENNRLRLEMAKTQLASGRAARALTLLKPLRDVDPDNVDVLKTLGVALDRQGDHAEAQAAYDAAMALGRPSAALLNNAALSHMLSGDLDRAETLLRDALVAPGSRAQIRQNLALVLSLRGKERLAREVSAQAVPRELANASIEAYSQIAGVSHPWTRAAQQ